MVLLMMQLDRSSDFSLPRMNVFTVIWKLCDSAALILVFRKAYIQIYHTIFRSPKTGRLTVDELIAGKTVHLAQFGRSMHELGIDLIFAKTPQAKGRIERLRGGSAEPSPD